MQPQNEILGLFLGFLLPYIALVWYFARPNQAPAIFWGLILVTTPLFALLTVNYSVRRVRRCNVDKLRRPSFDRDPLNWWFDPLQSLFRRSVKVSAGKR